MLRPPRPSFLLLPLLLLGPKAPPAMADQTTDLVRGVYVELSIGKSVPLEWVANLPAYSLAVPRDALYVAVRVAMASREDNSSATASSGAVSTVLTLRVNGFVLPFLPGEPSQYVQIATDVRTVLKVEIGVSEYTIFLIRSKIASNGQAELPDPARGYPPPGTLSGLALWDSLGEPAQMAWFMPRLSFYYASIGMNARDLRLVATPNDPGAELEWRRNGGKWDFLVSGLTSAPADVSANGWTLFEVRVRSAAAVATGTVSEPLVYQIAVTKELVCHPKCRACNGPGPEDCTACYAPLVLHQGKCFYTSCQAAGVYFDRLQEACLPCDPTCSECDGGTRQSCTICPGLRFLLAASALHMAGECVTTCPFGYYVQPTSQRCQRAPSSTTTKRYYIRLDLRVSVDDFTEQTDLATQVLSVAAETLAVSPQDVRFHKWVSVEDGLGVDYYLEVDNPFLQRADLEQQNSIDQWFAGLPVPIDNIRVMTEVQLYPPPLPPKAEPQIKPWMWGAAIGGFIILIVLYPMYHYYFIKMYFAKTPYRPRTHKQDLFVQEVLENAPTRLIRTIAHSSDRA